MLVLAKSDANGIPIQVAIENRIQSVIAKSVLQSTAISRP
jgi:hypothetical protein